MLQRPRMLSDGSLQYPQRGPHPAVPAGFQRDPGDPYRLILVLPECQYRQECRQVLPCKKVIISHSCGRGFPMSFAECTKCIASGKRDLV